MTHTVVVGTSEPQDMQLNDDNVPKVGTDLTVALVFRETVTGVTIAWLDQAGGTVRISGVENLTVGTYHLRYKLTDAGGKIGFIPNLTRPPDEWTVVAV